MNKEKIMKDLANTAISGLEKTDASISIKKPADTTDLDIDVKASPFQSAYMASAIGLTNRKIAVGMFGGLLCALFSTNQDEEVVRTIVDALADVLTEDELDILTEAAIASFIMKTSVASKQFDYEEKTKGNEKCISHLFGDIDSNGLQ